MSRGRPGADGAARGRRRGAVGRRGPSIGAAGLLATGLLAASGEVPDAERRVYEAVGRLPRAAAPGLWVVMQSGSLAAVFVAGGLALAARRPRMALAVAASGSTAWASAKLVKRVVERGRPASLLPDVTVYGKPQTGLGFPSGHAAVAAAMMTAASPYLSPARAGRRLDRGRPRRHGAHVRGRAPAARRRRRSVPRLDGRERGRAAAGGAGGEGGDRLRAAARVAAGSACGEVDLGAERPRERRNRLSISSSQSLEVWC